MHTVMPTVNYGYSTVIIISIAMRTTEEVPSNPAKTSCEICTELVQNFLPLWCLS